MEKSHACVLRKITLKDRETDLNTAYSKPSTDSPAASYSLCALSCNSCAIPEYTHLFNNFELASVTSLFRSTVVLYFLSNSWKTC